MNNQVHLNPIHLLNHALDALEHRGCAGVKRAARVLAELYRQYCRAYSNNAGRSAENRYSEDVVFQPDVDNGVPDRSS